MGRNILTFFLNLPWTCVGICTALLSIPTKVRCTSAPAIFVHVKSFWWRNFLHPTVRAMTHGHVILLSPQSQEVAVKEIITRHELVHIEQFKRFPFVFPFLYFGDSIFHGYKNNRFEAEAYRISGGRELLLHEK